MVTVTQAILLGLVAMLTWLDGAWLGEMKFREPIVTSFLVGLIMGDLSDALIMGAQLQLIWMGSVNVGPVAQVDVGTGGTIGVAVALATGTGIESAILFALPISILMQFVNSMLMSAYSGMMNHAEVEIDKLNIAGVKRTHYLCGIISAAVYFIFTFALMQFGGTAISTIVDGIPEWVTNGMNGVAALLPALGFALLMSLIMKKSLIPYFIIGFIPMAFIGHDLSMVGIVSIAVAVALIVFQLRNEMQEKSSTAVAIESSDDEWGD